MAWYVRARGRVIGPLTNEQLTELRDRGQVQEYDEVSRDQRTWQAAGLALAAPPPRPAMPPPRRRDPEPDPGPGPAGNPHFKLIVGGVAALVVLGGVVIGVLVTRNRGGDGGGSAGTSGSSGGGTTTTSTTGGAGGITIANQSTTERHKMYSAAVGLVVVGAKITWADGTWLESPEFGTGSGFVVTPGGYVITNRHVVEEMVNFEGSLQRKAAEKKGLVIAPKVWVFFGRDHKHPAEVVHVSQDYDLAVLKIDRAGEHYFALCGTEDVKIPPLDNVTSLGFPGSDRKALDILNAGAGKKASATKGAAIQQAFRDDDFNLTKENGGIKRTAVRAKPDAANREGTYLAHTARIRGGNSGGPLVARDGTVLGINTLGIITSVKLPNGQDLKIEQEGQNFALTLPQLRKEIDKHVPGVVWRSHPE